jgi:hypothetical protein
MRSRICSAFLITLLLSARAFGAEKLPAVERLKSCDVAVAATAAREILNDPASLREPIEMFTPTLALFQSGQKQEALFWFYAAQLRTRYQLVFEQGDRGQLLQIMLSTVGSPINNYGLSDTQNMQRTLDRVLEWDAKTVNPLREKTQTTDERERIAQVYSGLRQLRDKLVAEGPALEAQAKQSIGAQLTTDAERAKRCASGQLDPSLVEQQIRNEKTQVAELVKKNPDVWSTAAPIKSASVIEYVNDSESRMPRRYTVYVQGSRTVFAEVDVLRSGRDAQFALRCLTSVPPGNRRPGKDPCEQ